MRLVLVPLHLAAVTASLVIADPTYALETSTAGSEAAQASVDVVNSKIDTTNNFVNSIIACNAQRKFYAPSDPSKDANGCIGLGNSLATGTIVAFNGTACPAGFSEYVAARGKFLRGIDNGAGYDPAGTRAPGNYEGDTVGPHNHYFTGSTSYYAAAWGIYVTKNPCGSCAQPAAPGMAANLTVSGYTDNGDTGIGPETRPRNVATLFCVAN